MSDDTPKLAAIVEGHGEVEAVPVLIRRIALETLDLPRVDVPHPLRVPADRVRKAGELEKAVELLARKDPHLGGVLVLLDCDWPGACPAREGPLLLERARQARPDKPISLVLAKQEFESWFIASAESLAGKRGLRDGLSAPDCPEGIRGAKEWLTAQMAGNNCYTPTEHQAAFTSLFDMELARKRSASFDKCYREISRLLQKATHPSL